MDKQEIGKRLGIAFKSKGLKVAEVARKINVDRSNLSKIVNGKVGCGMTVLRSVAEAYGVSLEWLAFGTGEMFPSAKYTMSNDVVELIENRDVDRIKREYEHKIEELQEKIDKLTIEKERSDCRLDNLLRVLSSVDLTANKLQGKIQ